MLTRYSWLAGLLALGALLSHPGWGATEYTIDPARSLETANKATAKFVRGPSMLNTQAHPEIQYRAQRIVFSDGRPARIEGELTMLGITRSVALDVSRYDCTDALAPGERCAIVATANVKRSDFGMTRYMMFASDEVKLAIQAEGVRAEAVSRSMPMTYGRGDVGALPEEIPRDNALVTSPAMSSWTMSLSSSGRS